MLLQAAINGQGVALAWGSLVDDYLQSGALVRPVETVLRTQANFSMLEPADGELFLLVLSISVVGY